MFAAQHSKPIKRSTFRVRNGVHQVMHWTCALMGIDKAEESSSSVDMHSRSIYPFSYFSLITDNIFQFKIYGLHLYTTMCMIIMIFLSWLNGVRNYLP